MVPEEKIVIGAYPFRGNVHICRLLCAYLEMPFQNMFFNPQSWKNYRVKETSQWLFEQLPFLKDGDTVITHPMPMCFYIIKKSSREDLLGKNLDDMLVVDKFFWGRDLIQNFLSLVMQNKNNPAKLVEELKSNWVDMKQKLEQYENEARTQQFYLGYPSLIDFMIHEIFVYFKDILKKQCGCFPKLIAIKENIARMPVIKEFESSDKTVKDLCPLDFYRKWKSEVMKSCPESQCQNQCQ